MKRILVFSDTHGKINQCSKVIDTVPCDLILHAGDYADDAQQLKNRHKDKRLEYVKGNCDFFSYAPSSRVIELGGVNIFLVHGHEQQVKTDPNYRALARAARAAGCSLAVFGHTHMEHEGKTDGIMLLNPGSIKYGGTYGIIEIEDGTAKTCIIRGIPLF